MPKVKPSSRFLIIKIILIINIKIHFFGLFRATHVAYGGSQARGGIRAVAACLRQSHSYAGSELCLQPTPQLMATLDR